MRPKAAWVDCSSPCGAGSAGIDNLAERARALFAGDAAALDQRLDARPFIAADARRAAPIPRLQLIPIESRSAAVWVGFIRPA